MIIESKIIEIFCLADEFCKLIDLSVKKNSISNNKKEKLP